jgi:hypothetical protein
VRLFCVFFFARPFCVLVAVCWDGVDWIALAWVAIFDFRLLAAIAAAMYFAKANSFPSLPGNEGLWQPDCEVRACRAGLVGFSFFSSCNFFVCLSFVCFFFGALSISYAPPAVASFRLATRPSLSNFFLSNKFRLAQCTLQFTIRLAVPPVLLRLSHSLLVHLALLLQTGAVEMMQARKYALRVVEVALAQRHQAN